MVINTTAIFKDLAGQELKGEDGNIVTMRNIIVNALLSVLRGDEALTGTVKAQRFHLAQRAYTEDALIVTAEEVTLMKDCIGRAFAPIVVGQAYTMIENNPLEVVK